MLSVEEGGAVFLRKMTVGDIIAALNIPIKEAQVVAAFLQNPELDLEDFEQIQELSLRTKRFVRPWVLSHKNRCVILESLPIFINGEGQVFPTGDLAGRPQRMTAQVSPRKDLDPFTMASENLGEPRQSLRKVVSRVSNEDMRSTVFRGSGVQQELSSFSQEMDTRETPSYQSLARPVLNSTFVVPEESSLLGENPRNMEREDLRETEERWLRNLEKRFEERRSEEKRLREEEEGRWMEKMERTRLDEMKQKMIQIKKEEEKKMKENERKWQRDGGERRNGEERPGDVRGLENDGDGFGNTRGRRRREESEGDWFGRGREERKDCFRGRREESEGDWFGRGREERKDCFRGRREESEGDWFGRGREERKGDRFRGRRDERDDDRSRDRRREERDDDRGRGRRERREERDDDWFRDRRERREVSWRRSPERESLGRRHNYNRRRYGYRRDDDSDDETGLCFEELTRSLPRLQFFDGKKN